MNFGGKLLEEETKKISHSSPPKPRGRSCDRRVTDPIPCCLCSPRNPVPANKAVRGGGVDIGGHQELWKLWKECLTQSYFSAEVAHTSQIEEKANILPLFTICGMPGIQFSAIFRNFFHFCILAWTWKLKVLWCINCGKLRISPPTSNIMDIEANFLSWLIQSSEGKSVKIRRILTLALIWDKNVRKVWRTEFVEIMSYEQHQPVTLPGFTLPQGAKSR